MAGQFSIVWPKRRGPSDPWFRVGTVDATTTTIIAVVSVFSFFVYAIDKSLLRWLAFYPPDIVRGQLWRLATWPLLNQPDVWTMLTIGFLWWFGNQLENDFGRVRFTKFVGCCVIVPAVVTTGYFYLTGGATISNLTSVGQINLEAIRLLEIGVFVAYVAERPTARFFFGIPAWILAAVLVGVDILRYLGDRLFLAVIFELLTAAIALVLLRAFGFGHAVSWVPLVRLPGFLTSDGSGKMAKTRPTKVAKSKSSTGKGRGKTEGKSDPIVGPWAGSGSSSGFGSGSTESATQHDVDRILDKIAASGMNSLTSDEKAALEAASRARRDKNV